MQVSCFESYSVGIHLRNLHWSFSTKVVDADHMISATSSHEHSTYSRFNRMKLEQHLVKPLLKVFHKKITSEMKIFLPLLKEEVETCTPGRERSTNLTGWSLRKTQDTQMHQLLIGATLVQKSFNTYLNFMLSECHFQKHTMPSAPVEARYRVVPLAAGQN